VPFFPDEPGPGSASLLKLRMMEVVVTTGVMSCRAPVKSSPTNQHPTFYGADALPVTTSNIKALKGIFEKSTDLIIFGVQCPEESCHWKITNLPTLPINSCHSTLGSASGSITFNSDFD